MGAMYRLKAYFGMVPAEEMDDYADEPVERYAGPRGSRDRADDRWDGGWDDGRWDEGRPEDRYDGAWEPRPVRTAGRVAAERLRDPVRAPVAAVPGAGHPAGMPAAAGAGGVVRGALAVDPAREPVRPPEQPPMPQQRDRGAAPSTITTLQPRSYNEARTIGERYRDGVPVIMNLTELDDAAAKRLVDFAAGLAFALRGSIDKVTNRVFLLTPADVEVSADDARRLAERGILRQD
ncbi:MAG TPA: cell division protein SepF [Pseudonocardia sp.]|jgi:cell division inhibitor SepF|nr:cell division protein SepF [Pseudonocardia sp.]